MRVNAAADGIDIAINGVDSATDCVEAAINGVGQADEQRDVGGIISVRTLFIAEIISVGKGNRFLATLGRGDFSGEVGRN